MLSKLFGAALKVRLRLAWLLGGSGAILTVADG